MPWGPSVGLHSTCQECLNIHSDCKCLEKMLLYMFSKSISWLFGFFCPWWIHTKCIELRTLLVPCVRFCIYLPLNHWKTCWWDWEMVHKPWTPMVHVDAHPRKQTPATLPRLSQVLFLWRGEEPGGIVSIVSGHLLEVAFCLLGSHLRGSASFSGTEMPEI